ncbi:glycosyltransferase [Synechococcus sp. RSCCF101]|uniref:glycosyltransferase family 4 protein n=1 Tax=Synechococcus sp. RSCCF101 TaxID=2511069 RepID=UPI00124777A0|nr:glycosyltransferase family 4 protein [Synechococcus sp. RSCCF101]QEY31780.1 glycosyltransferase [Synechococcus sp. RSCCF101]
MPPLTVAVWGHLAGGFGLGEGARCTIRALEAAGLRVIRRDLPLATHNHHGAGGGPSPEAGGAPEEAAAAIDLIHTNPNVLRQTQGLKQALRARAPLRIGYWAWELEDFPFGWERDCADYDQIWCPSPHTATALSRRLPMPVAVVPHLIDWPRAERIRQARLERRRQEPTGSSGPFTVLASCDFWSTEARKNPHGALDAFQLAFPPEEGDAGVRCVLKLTSAGQFPAETEALQRRSAADPRITVLAEHLSETAFDALYSGADALISLHRAEGFGLTLAEAMAAELPVVATAYSGNLLFMPEGSAALVPFRRVVLSRSHADYRAGMHWAEPDAAAAGLALQRLRNDPAARQRLGEAGRQAVAEVLGREPVAARVREQIGSLLRWGGRRELLARLRPEEPLARLNQPLEPLAQGPGPGRPA